MKKTKKPKKPSRSKLVRKLDSIFSQYIRLKYSDSKWNCTCYTCWQKAHWKEMQNWHFLSRSNYKYRWSEDNCRVQDYRCNVIYKWNYKIYTIKMIEEYGKENIEYIINDKSLIKIKTYEIEEMIVKYTELVKKLETKLQKS